MHKWLRLTHIAGMVIFLGSIFTFILVSSLIESASLENLAFGREIISRGTLMLTAPGMGAIAISGLLLGYQRYGLRHPFFLVKALIISIIVLNTLLFILPAVNSATAFAQESLLQGSLKPEYETAYLQESIFGAVNVLTAIGAAIMGVWAQKNNSEDQHEKNTN